MRTTCDELRRRCLVDDRPAEGARGPTLLLDLRLYALGPDGFWLSLRLRRSLRVSEVARLEALPFGSASDSSVWLSLEFSAASNPPTNSASTMLLSFVQATSMPRTSNS